MSFTSRRCKGRKHKPAPKNGERYSTESRQFKNRDRITDRKHLGGVPAEHIAVFIDKGNKVIKRTNMRAQNRNPKVYRKMQNPKKLDSALRGKEFIENFIRRAFLIYIPRPKLNPLITGIRKTNPYMR